MSGMSQPPKSRVDQLSEAVEKVASIASTFAGNPFLVAGAQMVIKGIASIARREGIDPGPFDARVASLEALVDKGLQQDADYRQRHGE
jgi:hypothetical protein